MKDLKTEKPNDSDNDKLSVNFYISAGTLERIDDLIYFARKRVPMEKRRKLSKSIVYEACLKIGLEEFNARGEASAL